MSWFSDLAQKAKEVFVDVGAYVTNIGSNLLDRVEGYFQIGEEISEPPATTQEGKTLEGLDYRRPFLSEQEALDYLADVAAPSRVVRLSHSFTDPDTGEIDETPLYYPVIEDSP